MQDKTMPQTGSKCGREGGRGGVAAILSTKKMTNIMDELAYICDQSNLFGCYKYGPAAV